jgi:hypothetical protein
MVRFSMPLLKKGIGLVSGCILFSVSRGFIGRRERQGIENSLATCTEDNLFIFSRFL